MDDRGRLAQPLKRSRHTRARSSDFAYLNDHGGRLRTFVLKLRPILDLHVPRGAGAATTAMLLLAALAYGAVRGGHVDAMTQHMRALRDVAANAAGFRIAAVALGGQKEISREEILAAAGVTGTTSLLFLDAEAARERLKSNPWIAEATILKLYPDRLHISITERHAFALWQLDGKVAVIAADGTVVQSFVDQRFANLPLVVGRGADRKANEFLAIADRYPAIREAARAFVLVGERRWNMRMKSGVDVRLPESDPARAFETLVALDREQKILSRDILAIDLRLPDRVTVRLSEPAAAARAESFKDKRIRRKGDDA